MTTSTPSLPWPPLPPLPPTTGRPAPLTADLSFAPEPSMVSWLRDAAASTLASWGVEAQVVQDTLVILSELTSNVLVHGIAGPAEPITVRLQLDRWDGTLSGSVTDSGPGWPCPRDVGTDCLDEGGRGLLLVGMLSTKWGVTRESDGVHKSVWWCIAVPRMMIDIT